MFCLSACNSLCMCMHARMHVCTCVHMRVRINARACTHTHSHIHTHTHSHALIFVCILDSVIISVWSSSPVNKMTDLVPLGSAAHKPQAKKPSCKISFVSELSRCITFVNLKYFFFKCLHLKLLSVARNLASDEKGEGKRPLSVSIRSCRNCPRFFSPPPPLFFFCASAR